MENEHYRDDLKEFWSNRKRAREERDKQLAELPFSEKIAITESLQREARAIESAKCNTIGLGVTSPDALNHYPPEIIFTQSDFDAALNKVFPSTQELQDDQESSET